MGRTVRPKRKRDRDMLTVNTPVLTAKETGDFFKPTRESVTVSLGLASGHGETKFKLTIEDSRSRLRLLDIDLDLASFGELIGNRLVTAEARVFRNSLPVLGCDHEYQVVEMTGIRGDWPNRYEHAESWLKEHGLWHQGWRPGLTLSNDKPPRADEVGIERYMRRELTVVEL